MFSNFLLQICRQTGFLCHVNLYTITDAVVVPVWNGAPLLVVWGVGKGLVTFAAGLVISLYWKDQWNILALSQCLLTVFPAVYSAGRYHSSLWEIVSCPSAHAILYLFHFSAPNSIFCWSTLYHNNTPPNFRRLLIIFPVSASLHGTFTVISIYLVFNSQWEYFCCRFCLSGSVLCQE